MTARAEPENRRGGETGKLPKDRRSGGGRDHVVGVNTKPFFVLSYFRVFVMMGFSLALSTFFTFPPFNLST